MSYSFRVSLDTLNGSTRQRPRDQSTTTRHWIRGLLSPDATVRGLSFGTGTRLPCLACYGEQDKFLDLDVSSDTNGLSGPMMSVRLRDRLSVSVYAIRRGINSHPTRALGRTSFYHPLVELCKVYYHRESCVIFIYFATLVHF